MRPDAPALQSKHHLRLRRSGAAALLCIGLTGAAGLSGPAIEAGASVPVPDRSVLTSAGYAAIRQDTTGLPDPEPSADQSRRDAHEILARGEYQEPPKTLLEKVTTWLGEQLQKLFSSFTGGSGGALAWVILAVLVGVAIFLVTRIRGGVFSRRRRQDDPLFQTTVEARRSPTEWLTEAERLEASGDWKAALRCRYRALIGGLIGAQILRDIPGRTTGEYRIEIRRAGPGLAADFAAATELFERAWYGDEPTGPVESGQFRSLAAGIDERSRRRDDTPAAVPT